MTRIRMPEDWVNPFPEFKFDCQEGNAERWRIERGPDGIMFVVAR